MRAHRLKRRLFWAALLLAVSLLALAGVILRAVESVGSAARKSSPAAGRRRSAIRARTADGRAGASA
jgi:Tfp pilus assembly protein PilV